jgi:hypothetical protein
MKLGYTLAPSAQLRWIFWEHILWLDWSLAF